MEFSYRNYLICISSLLISSIWIFFIQVTPSNALSQSEKTLKVGVSLYSPPIFFDEEDRFAVQGISVDMARMVADNTGSSIRFYTMDELDYANVLEEGTVDILIGIKEDFENPEAVNLIETGIMVDRHFFVNSECDTFTSLHDLPGHKVIIRGGDFVSRLLTSRNDITFIDPKTEEEGLALLDSGEVQVYISHSSLLDLDEIKKRGFHNIREVGKPVINAPLVIASKKDNVELNSSLQDAYEKAMNSSQYNQILNLWVNRDLQFVNPNKKNIMLFLAVAFKYILIVIGVVILSFSGIIFWNNMLKRNVNKVKKELYQSEQRYKDLIESSPDMIHLVYPDGRIRLSNKMALNCLGYDEDEIGMMRVHDLVSAEDVDRITLFLDQAFKENYAQGEFALMAKDGIAINVEIVATIVKWGSNGEELICTYSRDLTERRRLEENLIHSDRLAVMGQMAAGIAHEINNPLGIILTNAGELINHELSTEDARESIKSIERNALRSAKIIEDLLSFTRPSPLNKTSIDLISLIDESLLFLKHRINNKKIKIEKIYSSEALISLGDERMIQQLLINLILNAIQAVRHEGKIEIAAGVTEGAGESNMSIEIKDNGVGIHNGDMKKIFNPFYTSRKEEGFGLGLYISKIIVEKHNGRISVESEFAKGTVVTVLIPAATGMISAAA